MINLFADPKNLLLAILGGVIPAILWLHFWLREEDSENTEPRGLIALAFLLGCATVMIAIFLERASVPFLSNYTTRTIVWAAIEELVKLLGVALIFFGSGAIDKPIDYPMYFIAVALGFAAFENILYLIHPVGVNGTVISLLTGNLRFLGSTLLHAIASSMIGSALGLSFFIKEYRTLYLFFGNYVRDRIA
jgi:RsiW-degrading membrane proteinase PrsW (M82 family)